MEHPWISRRSVVYGRNGMVATSQPLASEAGLSILKRGGNAADAAIAIASTLNVTQPNSTGVGGDMFMIYYDAKTKKLHGLNASGRCPGGLSVEKFYECHNEKGHLCESNRPDTCGKAWWITVPGCAAGWVDAVERFGSGKLTLKEILTPAIDLAEKGHAVSQVTAHCWKVLEDKLVQNKAYSYLVDGVRAPNEGEIFKMPELAQTFRELAEHGKKGFYKGRIAQAIVDTVNQHEGGFMSLDDLSLHKNTFDDPVHINYRGTDIYEMPPNGQGITALLALNIMEGWDIGKLQHGSAEHLHKVIEALRLAFADTRYYVADPTFYNVPVKELLSKNYAAHRRGLFNPNKAAVIDKGSPVRSSNTVYFSVIDGEGNAVSCVNSNYTDFGSFIVPPGCGFILQCRGHNFSLDKSHPNCLAPWKRPYHTIIPGMAFRGGELWGPFGVMGAFMQPQGHVQVISNMIDFGMDPQQALDAPRIMIRESCTDTISVKVPISLEEGITQKVCDQLSDMGHNVKIETGWTRMDFGQGQIILRDPDTGVLRGGSDPRNDGLAIGW